MNTLTVAAFACVVVLASAVPSGLWGLGYGHHGHEHLPLVGASGVVSSHGAAGPAGVVNGHGAVGPNGIPNAVGHGGVIVGAHGLAYGHGHDDGQWHGEGLVASQDWAGHGHGHGVAVIAPHSAAIISPAVHGLGLGHGVGLGHGIGLGHGVAVGHGIGHGTIVAGPSGTIVADGIHGHHGLAHHGGW